MNKNYILLCAFALICALLFQSCATKRNLVYFSDLNDSVQFNQEIKNLIEPRIQPEDALSIKVTTLNPDANILYSSGSLPMSNENTGISTSANKQNNTVYMVDNEGNINFPLLGKINVRGLTVRQAQERLQELISKTDKGVIVNITIQNFKVTVIGEVSRPGTFNIPDDKVNVLEALGMAGDMTPYSVRENVLIVREKNGIRSMQRLDLTKKDVFNSPFFYLQQNDVVYVQPENKLKAQQANSGDFRIWSIIVSGLSVLSLFLYRFR